MRVAELAEGRANPRPSPGPDSIPSPTLTLTNTLTLILTLALCSEPGTLGFFSACVVPQHAQNMAQHG